MTKLVTNSRRQTTRIVLLVGTCGLLAITVIQGLSVVDQWEVLRSEQAELKSLQSGDLDAQRAQQFELQIAQVKRDIDHFHDKMIGSAEMSIIQSDLLDLARQCGCQLKKAVIQSEATEDWVPLVDELAQGEEYEPTESPYEVLAQQLSIRLTGSRMQTYEFLQQIHQRPWLMRIAQISFTRSPDVRGELVVEANLAYYELNKKPLDRDDVFF